MNVLQLAKFYPPVHGGMETTTRELVEGLNGRGVRTDVLCADIGGHRIVERIGDCTVTRAASLGTVLSTSMSPDLVWQLLRKRSRYDVLHVHLPNPMANLALWIARWPGPMVVHWHSDIVHQQRALRLYAPLQQWLLRRADAIIATSDTYARHSIWLRPWLDKVQVVPLGITPDRGLHDPARLAQAVQALRAQHGGRRLVLALGRMASYKGFEHLIEAVRHLRPDARIVVAGAGELLEARRARVIAAGLEDRIAFPGRLTDLDVAAHLAVAQVFCLPSINRAEAFGTVLLEAMAARLPIVATTIEASGVPWVNVDGETGLNVPVGDPVALAQAINTLLDDPARARRMGEEGHARLQRLFTADRMVERTLEVYRGVLATPSRKRRASTG